MTTTMGFHLPRSRLRLQQTTLADQWLPGAQFDRMFEVFGLCVSKHIQNISCFNKFGISRRKSQSFHQFFPPSPNSRGHREFPHPWCSESRGGPGTLMQIRQLGLKVFLRISGHPKCHTNRDAFWGWPSRLWARKSMLKCSTVDLYSLWLHCDSFLTALKVENWYVDICELWLELWPCFDPSALHFKFQVSIPSIETSTATRCRMIKASPFGLFGRISPATSMRVAWSRKGVSGCVSSGDVVQNITLHDMRTAEQERYDFHIPILCALSKHRPSQNPSQNVQ